jgi:hypothetical protein
MVEYFAANILYGATLKVSHFHAIPVVDFIIFSFTYDKLSVFG